ncbi:hypothetical protein O0L34_g12489 [Tuta absoluta]|nr:hypothetical protein O0L34_g12489 [Tuta absoluta]
MVPLWVEEGAEEEEPGRARRDHPAEHAARWHARHLERVGHLDRRRTPGGVPGRWVRAAAAGPGRPIARLKPCLSVCQLVEQHCPYFLPADRAPAYPTQYAGEPTFLCLDERIPETGAQKNKSNYGSDDCCYWYCEGRLCYHCDKKLDEAERPDAETCSPLDERVATCSVPYQAPSAAPPRTRHVLALVTPLLVLMLAAARTAHTHRTLSTSLVNVRDSRL